LCEDLTSLLDEAGKDRDVLKSEQQELQQRFFAQQQHIAALTMEKTHWEKKSSSLSKELASMTGLASKDGSQSQMLKELLEVQAQNSYLQKRILEVSFRFVSHVFIKFRCVVSSKERSEIKTRQLQKILVMNVVGILLSVLHPLRIFLLKALGRRRRMDSLTTCLSTRRQTIPLSIVCVSDLASLRERKMINSLLVKLPSITHNKTD
jgi:hypothetical protein